MTDGPPPPPPPHGTQPKSTGLPPGNYDIFIIPPHASGSGFLYLPSLQPHVNSFIAGFASALVLVALTFVLKPLFDTIKGGGGPLTLILMFTIGLGAWALGRMQSNGESRPGPSQGPGMPPHGGAYTSANDDTCSNDSASGGGSQTSGTGFSPGSTSEKAGGPPPNPQAGAGARQRSSSGCEETPPPSPGADPEMPGATPRTTPGPTPGSNDDARAKENVYRAAWEEARERTRRKEAERKRVEAERKRLEAERKRKEDLEKRLKELRAKEVLERATRERKQKEEREARERKEKEEREAKERRFREELEAREKRERAAREKEREERERLAKMEREEQEARERKAKEERETRQRIQEEAEAKARADYDRRLREEVARREVRRKEEEAIRREQEKLRLEAIARVEAEKKARADKEKADAEAKAKAEKAKAAAKAWAEAKARAAAKREAKAKEEREKEVAAQIREVKLKEEREAAAAAAAQLRELKLREEREAAAAAQIREARRREEREAAAAAQIREARRREEQEAAAAAQIREARRREEQEAAAAAQIREARRREEQEAAAAAQIREARRREEQEAAAAAQIREAKRREERDAAAAAASIAEQRKPNTYSNAGVGERISPWPNGKPPMATPTSPPAYSMPRFQAPNPSPQKPPPPAARTYAGTDKDSQSHSSYAQPPRPARKKSLDSLYSESSYAASQSTSKTTPPPSTRGPYRTKDPDKIVIKGVFAFNNAFHKTPTSQLLSGVGSVTDGLILRITTEGLFIDDDVRGVAQREWDVKAWTMKLVEVWCPSFRQASRVPPATTAHKNPVRRLWGLDKELAASEEEKDTLLVSMLQLCRDNCRAHAMSTSSAAPSVSGSVYSASSYASSDRRSSVSSDYADSVASSYSPYGEKHRRNTNHNAQMGENRTAGLHILRASIRDQEGKKYVFVVQESEAWKVALGLQRLRRGTQVRSLGVSGMSPNDAKATLENLGWI